MSAWRRKAITYLPQLKPQIERAQSPGELWSEIEERLPLQLEDSAFCDAMLSYLDWCCAQKPLADGCSPADAVYSGFLENLASNPAYWPLFPLWFSKAQFAQFQGSFEYALTQQDFQRLQEIFYGRG